MIKGLIIRRTLIGLLASAAIVVASNYLIIWPGGFEQAVSCVLYPALVFQRQCVDPVKSWFAHKHTVNQLEAALSRAQQEHVQLQATIIELQASIGYAADCKELMEFKQRYSCADAVLAQVLVRNLSEQSQFFILDAGSKKGIKKNMVAVYKNNLIGKVVEVFPFYCKLLLITDRLCKVSAYCAQTRASGIHAGLNTRNKGELLHVSHLAMLKEGDLILSTGDGLVFPRGFALGQVQDFTYDDLFCAVSTKLLVDMHTIPSCYLLQKGAETIVYLDENTATTSQVIQ